jgi:lipoprotein-releasing system permease protein
MYKFILAIRYLVRRRISWLALIAVALCVFIVIVVMTVMTGLVRDFKEKNHEFTGDCVVGTESLTGFGYYEDFEKELNGEDFVEAVSPVIRSYGLVNAAHSERSIGVEIMGIDPVNFSRVTDFAQTLHYRKGDAAKAFVPEYDPNLPGCVAGIDLWLNRDARGNYLFESSPSRTALEVTCFPLTAKGALAKAGTELVNTKTFYFSDVSQSGLARVDGDIIYLPFEQAQVLCGMAGAIKRAGAIHIKFKPGVNLEQGSDKVRVMWQKFVEAKAGAENVQLLKQVRVESWKEYRRETIAAMEKEQVMVTFMFALVGITTVFIVFVVFYMIVSHKSKDIGILKSVGVSSGNVVGLFLYFAFLVGILGSALGTLSGWAFLKNINRIEAWLYEHFGFQLWDRSIYAIGAIPDQISPRLLAVIIICAIAACLTGAFLPSRRASRMEPVESLQVSQL